MDFHVTVMDGVLCHVIIQMNNEAISIMLDRREYRSLLDFYKRKYAEEHDKFNRDVLDKWHTEKKSK